MTIAKRVLISAIAIAVFVPTIWWLLGELVIYYEWFATGANSRAELGNDLGLGILLFMVVPAGTLIATILFAYWIWIRTGRCVQT